MNTDILVPITLLIVIMLIVKTLLTFQERNSRQWHQTLRQSIESGKQANDGVFRRLTIAIDPKKSDLRRAIFYFSIALILFLLGWLVPFQDREGNSALLIISAIPFGFSLTYLYFWKFWYR